MGEFVGKRVVPDHVGVWDQKKTYEPLMIVLDGETGDSYISRKAVPVGVSLADESYWSLCAHYSAQMRKLEQDVDVDVQQMHSDVTAVKNVFVGRAVYEVVAGDNLWRIAERKLGSGTRYTDIRELNGLTSNAIRIGMKLLLP